MVKSVVIRYTSGTKASAVERIPIAGRKELTAGRAPTCDIRYDVANDDLVSRRHMKIEISGGGEPVFTIFDLNSRNGTFVNKRLLTRPTKLRPGDVVQLGTGGPEFVFDVDPPLAQEAEGVKTTAYNVISEPTQAVPAPPKPASPSSPPPPVNLQPATTASRSGRKFVTALVFVLLVGSAAAAYVFRPVTYVDFTGTLRRGWAALVDETSTVTKVVADRNRDLAQKLHGWMNHPKPAKEIARDNVSAQPQRALVNANSLTNIEAGWMLLDARSGRQLRQVYIDNSKSGADGSSALVPNGGHTLPLFVLLNDNRLQPVLTVSDDVTYHPIGGTYRNEGFIASTDGLILTSRRIATPWTVPYEWPADATAGVVAKFDKRLKLINTAVIARRQFPRWLPLDSQFILAGSLNAPSLRLSNNDVKLDGRTDYLTVGMGAESRRVSARVVRASDRFDLAVIRMENDAVLAQHPSAFSLRQDSDCGPGDTAIVLGVPKTRSATRAEPGSESTGKVLALRREHDNASGTVHPVGDRYELAMSTHSAPEAGMPVFDAQGRVFAIEAPADPLNPSNVTAMPIRYGLELLSASRN